MKIYNSFNALYNSVCNVDYKSMIEDLYKKKSFEHMKLNNTPLPVQKHKTDTGKYDDGFCWGKSFYFFSDFLYDGKWVYHMNGGTYEDPIFVELTDDGKWVNIYS